MNLRSSLAVGQAAWPEAVRRKRRRRPQVRSQSPAGLAGIFCADPWISPAAASANRVCTLRQPTPAIFLPPGRDLGRAHASGGIVAPSRDLGNRLFREQNAMLHCALVHECAVRTGRRGEIPFCAMAWTGAPFGCQCQGRSRCCGAACRRVPPQGGAPRLVQRPASPVATNSASDASLKLPALLATMRPCASTSTVYGSTPWVSP